MCMWIYAESTNSTFSDYDQISPPHSFIHVDSFSSFSELGKYLEVLRHDEEQAKVGEL